VEQGLAPAGLAPAQVLALASGNRDDQDQETNVLLQAEVKAFEKDPANEHSTAPSSTQAWSGAGSYP
jgi:hypothetical protein